jgi:DNA (cytosine-5)-methyltransferase 1
MLKRQFTFIDLFAGIGGFRIACESLGGKCVFSSEIDKYAQKTYEANFGDVPYGDITKIHEKDVPDHDVLQAGFPCQAFSIAGRKGGFNDTRGTLFFDVARIIKEKRPKAFFLENVKGIVSHNKGKTLSVILNTLREDLDYYVPDPEIINAKDFGVPQNRERIFIVGFRKDLGVTHFQYPKPLGIMTTFADVKEEDIVSAKYYLSTQYLNTLIEHKARHEAKGNGFGYDVIQDNQIANAIVVGGMGRERNLVIDTRLKDFTPVTNIKSEINREGIRRMTPREWARLQGFPDSFQILVSDAQAYKQFGNSVAVPAIRETARLLIEHMISVKELTLVC